MVRMKETRNIEQVTILQEIADHKDDDHIGNNPDASQHQIRNIKRKLPNGEYEDPKATKRARGSNENFHLLPRRRHRLPPQIQIWLRLRRKRKIEMEDRTMKKRPRLGYIGQRNEPKLRIRTRRQKRGRRITVLNPSKEIDSHERKTQEGMESEIRYSNIEGEHEEDITMNDSSQLGSKIPVESLRNDKHFQPLPEDIDQESDCMNREALLSQTTLEAAQLISDDHGDAVDKPIEPESPSRTNSSNEVMRGDNISRPVEDIQENIDNVRSKKSKVASERKYGPGVGDGGMRHTKKRRNRTTEESNDKNVMRNLHGDLANDGSIAATSLKVHGMGDKRNDCLKQNVVGIARNWRTEQNMTQGKVEIGPETLSARTRTPFFVE